MTGSTDSNGKESLAAQFETIWESEGTSPDVFAFLSRHPTASTLECLDVLLVDQRRRAESDTFLSVEEYLQACPGIATDPGLKLDLVAGEMSQLARLGRRPALDSYALRFPDLSDSLTILSHAEPWSGDKRGTRASGRAGREAPRPDGPWAGERFSIRSPLGAGGMGVVYRAYDRQRRQMVALKMMRRLDPVALYRFKQEFRSLADVTHPNLVILHELVAEADQWCFTMELVDGTDFLGHVRPSGSLQDGSSRPSSATPEALDNPEGDRPEVASSFHPQRLRRTLIQFAEGLHALHNAGKIHRDLKPSNVLVSREGRVVILDFGLVAELESTGGYQSTEQHVVGTVHYMAPEQAAAGAVSPASDWYSVGVMLYQALTGRLPHVGTSYEVLMAKQNQRPRSPAEFVPSLPEDLLSLCLDLLEGDPASRPSGGEVLRRLVGGLADGELDSTPPKRMASIPLVGRDRHLAALGEAFEEVKRGLTGVVCVHGRSGAGKSALVHHFLEGVAEQGDVVVLSGRCYEQESVPYKALDSLVDSLSRYLNRLPASQVEALLPRDVHPLTRVFPVLQRVKMVAAAPRVITEPPDPHELRRRAFASLRELLARLGDRRPLVLAIDDLQWGDADSAILLSELFRPPDSPVLLAVASFRDEDAATNPFLLNLLSWRDADGLSLRWRDLQVDELSPLEARSLALLLLGQEESAPSGQAEIIARESVGNPFFVHELVQSLQAGGPTTGIDSSGSIALDQVLSARIARLPNEARHLLEFVAVAGRPITLDVATQQAESSGVGQAAIAVLRSGRLVRIMGGEESEEIETYHDRIREVVVQRLSPDDLKSHHLRLAHGLESGRNADAEFVAGHFFGGGDTKRAGHYYEIAAAQAADALAFDRATNLYRLSLSIRPEGDPERLSLLVRLGDALANAGRGVEAAREYLLAAPEETNAEAKELRRRAAMQLLISGHVEEGLSILRRVLDAGGMRLPQSSWRSLLSLLYSRLKLRVRGTHFVERSEAQISPEVLNKIDTCWSVVAGLTLIDPIIGLNYQTRYVLLALRAGEPRRISRALAFEAAHRAAAGGFARKRTAELFRSAGVVARKESRPIDIGFLLLSKGCAHYLEGDWKDAFGACLEADAVLRDRCTGVSWELTTLDTFTLWSLIYLGEVEELKTRWTLKLRQARERGNLFAEMNLCTYIMAIALLGEDRPGLAQEELDRAKALWTPAGFHVQHHNVTLGQCHIHLYNGASALAWSYIEEQWQKYRRSYLLRVQQVRIDALQLRARSALALAFHDPRADHLLKEAERDACRLDREKMAWSDAHAQAIRAMVAAARGDVTSARLRLADAVRRYDLADMGLYAASARRRLGSLVGGVEGDRMVEEADSSMLRLGVRCPEKFANMYMPGFPTRI